MTESTLRPLILAFQAVSSSQYLDYKELFTNIIIEDKTIQIVFDVIYVVTIVRLLFFNE